MKKWKLWIGIVVIVVIFFIFFIKSNYKILRFGNNEINKSVKEVEEYILGINSYEATIEVTVNSNKNVNKYVIKQEQVGNGKSQVVLKPENIAGVEIKSSSDKLQVLNSKLNLSEIYNDYSDVSSNALWLSSFIEAYKNKKNETSIYEEGEEIVMQVKEKESKNIKKRLLYLERETGRPKKMVVEGDNKKYKVYILYNEIVIKK